MGGPVEPAGAPTSPAPARHESGWPPAVAALTVAALPLFVPDRLTLGPSWLTPAIAGAFVLGFAVEGVRVSNRARGHRHAEPNTAAAGSAVDGQHARVLLWLSVGLTAAFVLGSAWTTVWLLGDILSGGPTTNSASTLLATGGLVWVSNNVVFAFLYWELDTGGPIAGPAEPSDRRGFAFPQQLNPDVAEPGWQPTFVDYLYVGLTNATAFSPTDAMPLRPWAKLTMAMQALLSITVLSLVIARAVNVMT